MKIDMKITGIKQILDSLDGIEDDVKREALKAGQQIGDKFLEESAKRAPIDEGNLEKSHEKEVEQKGIGFEGKVYITSNSPAGDYAMWAHEADYNLGDNSRRKQAGSNVIVGRKYMERAFNDNYKRLYDYLVKKIRSVIR